MKKVTFEQYISTVNDFGTWDISKVGGKAYSLSQLFSEGFNVPKAICINTDGYFHFINQNTELVSLIDNYRLSGFGHDLFTILENKINSIHFSDDFKNKILIEIEKLGHIDSDYFAIRSSATTEDLKNTSFAGLHDTFLNVQGMHNILQSLKNCWLSLWSERAVIYREQNDIAHHLAKMAVVIQKMIPSEKSGVTFSINPVNGNINEILINVVSGEGEKLVSGIVTPAEYVVNKNKFKVTSQKNTADYQNILNRDELKQLLNAANKIESFFDLPQDIEWAIVKNEIFILQARAITTCETILNTKDIVGSWTRIGFDDWLRKPMTPLFETLAIPVFNDIADNFIAQKLKLYRRNPTWTSIHGFFYTRINCKFSFLTILIPYYFIKLVKTIFREWNDNFVVQHENKIKKLMQSKPVTAKEIKAHLDAIIAENGLAWAYIIVTGISAKLSEKIFSTCFNTFVPSKYKLNYTQILSGYFNKSIEADEALWQVAMNAKYDEQLYNYLISDRNKTFEEIGIYNLTWLTELQTWLNNYGHRLFELDFSFPTLKEDTYIVLDIIKHYLENDKSLSPHSKFIENYQQSEEYRKLFVNEICKKALFGKLLLRTFKLAENYSKIRENRPFYLHYGWPIMREDILRIAKLAKDKNIIQAVEDIFFISQIEFNKIIDLMSTGGSYSEEDIYRINAAILHNKMLYKKRCKNNIIPVNVTSNIILKSLLKLFSSEKHKQSGDNIFQGFSGSPGFFEGIICKVEGKEDFHKFRQNQILLALYTTPVWTPLLSLAGGVVTQNGGSLSHAAIVAREYQIPAVLGIQNIFQILNDGDQVLLDGNNGTLKIIKKNN